MRKPIITLLTDFGITDPYVASMKGVILNINPRCTLIDITHHVNPHDMQEGAFLLAKTYSYFPKGTIHLSVVDPGVGGARKPILLETKNYFFVGPDNGLFTLVAEKEKGEADGGSHRKEIFSFESQHNLPWKGYLCSSSGPSLLGCSLQNIRRKT